MKYFAKIYLLIIILMSVCSCDDPKEGETYQIYDRNPISTYMESRPDDFSEWITVLKYADLFNAINVANQYFTVFTPNNEAVKSFYTKKGVNSIEDLGYDYARNLVKYHIIGDTVTTEDLTLGKIETPTLSEDYLSVNFGDDGFNTMFINNEALILEHANRASNGFVYVLKSVLSPLTETVYDRISQSDQYSIMERALALTSWKDSLSVVADTIVEANGKKQIVKRNYTLLSVSDASFGKDNISSIDNLISKLGAGSDYKDPKNALFKYVAYHIIEGTYYISDLEKFEAQDDKSKVWNTKAKNEVLQISLVDGQYYINYDGSKTSFVDDSADVVAKNGIVHQVDNYLPVWQPDPVTVLFDFCDYPILASYIETDGTSGQKYQTVHASNEYRTEVTKLSCYTVKIANPGSYNSYNAVDYFTAKTGNNFKDAKFYDMLILNVGYTGSIAMETPAIIKGKYKVTLYFGYATSMNFIRQATSGSNGGATQFSFDDNISVTAKPYSAVSANTLGMYNAVIFDEVEFETTSTHTFKIVVMDPAASMSAVNFRLQLDYLLFEPI